MVLCSPKNKKPACLEVESAQPWWEAHAENGVKDKDLIIEACQHQAHYTTLVEQVWVERDGEEVLRSLAQCQMAS